MRWRLEREEGREDCRSKEGKRGQYMKGKVFEKERGREREDGRNKEEKEGRVVKGK